MNGDDWSGLKFGGELLPLHLGLTELGPLLQLHQEVRDQMKCKQPTGAFMTRKRRNKNSIVYVGPNVVTY
jgi:hypothetical protein